MKTMLPSDRTTVQASLSQMMSATGIPHSKERPKLPRNTMLEIQSRYCR